MLIGTFLFAFPRFYVEYAGNNASKLLHFLNPNQKMSLKESRFVDRFSCLQLITPSVFFFTYEYGIMSMNSFLTTGELNIDRIANSYHQTDVDLRSNVC